MIESENQCKKPLEENKKYKKKKSKKDITDEDKNKSIEIKDVNSEEWEAQLENAFNEYSDIKLSSESSESNELLYKDKKENKEIENPSKNNINTDNKNLIINSVEPKENNINNDHIRKIKNTIQYNGFIFKTTSRTNYYNKKKIRIKLFINAYIIAIMKKKEIYQI